jgi:hypothetical protein
MSRRLCLCCVALTLVAALLVFGPPAATAPAPVVEKTKVELVFCIDTTGSMTEWLQMCKNKFWSICHQVAGGRPTPELKVGLVDYKDRGDVWITKVYDLTDDLDAVYSNLSTFTANGGGDEPESVNQALYDSVHKIKWSKDKRTLRIILLVGDAHPHMDYPDDVKYPVTCKEAIRRGIFINALQCGSAAMCEKYFKDIAVQAGGVYFKVQQSNTVRTFSTSADRRLREINAELAKSILTWGDTAKRDGDQKKAQVCVSLGDSAPNRSQQLAEAVAADRVGIHAKFGRTAVFDLLDATRAGKVRLDAIKTEELPADLQKLPARDRREHLVKVGQQRTALLREALQLDRKRQAELAKEIERARDCFDAQILDILHKQSRKARIRY